MEIYEMNLKVYLLRDIYSKEALEKIGNLIDKCLGCNKNLLFNSSNLS